MLRGRISHLDDDVSGGHRRRPAQKMSGGCKTVHFHREDTSREEPVAPKARAAASKAAVATRRHSFRA